MPSLLGNSRSRTWLLAIVCRIGAGVWSKFRSGTAAGAIEEGRRMRYAVRVSEDGLHVLVEPVILWLDDVPVVAGRRGACHLGEVWLRRRCLRRVDEHIHPAVSAGKRLGRMTTLLMHIHR